MNASYSALASPWLATAAPGNNNHHAVAPVQAPRSSTDARAAFDNLFKKPE